MRSISLSVLLVVGAGCNSFLDVDSNEDGKLAEALVLWEAAALTDYDFTIANYCSCEISPAVAEVEVRDGEIVSIVDDSTDEPAVDPSGIQSIPELFALVQAAIDAPASVLWASYDFRYGYPTLIEIDPDGRAEHDEFQIRVGRFRVVVDEGE